MLNEINLVEWSVLSNWSKFFSKNLYCYQRHIHTNFVDMKYIISSPEKLVSPGICECVPSFFNLYLYFRRLRRWSEILNKNGSLIAELKTHVRN